MTPQEAITDNETKRGIKSDGDQAEKHIEAVVRQRRYDAGAAGDNPLSLAQERYWILDHLESGTASHSLLFAVELSGHLDVAALEASLTEIVRRYESLHITFRQQGGELFPVIEPPSTVTLPISDLGRLSPEQQESEIQRALDDEANRSFSLENGPLARYTLLRLSERRHILLITAHPIILDSGSLSLLYRELGAIYDALSSGQPLPLSEPAVHYMDFARWQRRWLQSETCQAQLAYWNRQLNDLPAALELPVDRPRPAVRSYNPGSLPITLSGDPAGALQSLSRQEDVTPFMLLLAAFQILLYRYTGQTDVPIGTSIPNRSQDQFRNLIGPIANTLVLRTDLTGAPTFRQLLDRVKEVTLGAYAHQDLPFEKLVEALQPERSLSHTPLFQVMFTFQEENDLPLKLSSLTLRPIQRRVNSALADLALHLALSETGLTGSLEYNADLFDAATMQRLTDHFKTLLEGAVANPDLPISRLPLLTEAELRQLLVEFNPTSVDYPHDCCVHHLFQAQVERTPDSVAVVFEDQQLTFRELNNSANQLAHYLLQRGVGPGVLVGLCVERGMEMMVGLLGILKAGGAYVPMDPSYPAERLAFMLEDAQIKLLLTQQRLCAEMSTGEAEVICLDGEWPETVRAHEENPNIALSEDDLAYVIFTSGSTGKPKGVQIPHRALTNFLLSMQAEPGLNAKDTLLAVTTLSFDIAGLELFLPLIAGAKLIVVSRELAVDGVRLAALLSNANVTIMQATPATWRLLLDADWQGKADLKILCGGEAMPVDLAAALQTRCASLWNMYGPTETTIWSTIHRVIPGEDTILIGRPIANTQVYILDGQQQPVPLGVTGELYIGGDGLARGYLNRPELTAEKFVEVSIEGLEALCSVRLFRTGDLARYRSNGAIECLGRVDHQVKVRGFRIELGEITAVLAQHPSIREAVVVAHEYAPGDKRLVAYLVPDPASIPPTGELRQLLQTQLPEYMVPSTFVMMDALPQTPNGKIDRRSLPSPLTVRAAPDHVAALPRDALELQLCKLWEEVLKTHSVGVGDNFFELGGNSLLAVRLFGQIQRVFGKTLPLATLFQAPTIEQLANVLRQEGWEAPWSPLVPIRLGSNKPPFYCVHGAGANVVHLAGIAKYLEDDQPFYGLQSVGLDGKQEPYTRAEEMAAHYIREIRSAQPQGPYYLGGLSFGGIVAFEMARQLDEQGEVVALLALLDTNYPDKRRYPTNRSWLFRAKIYPFVERAEMRLNDLKRQGIKGAVLSAPRNIIRAVAAKLRKDGHAVIADDEDLLSHLPPVLQKVWRANLKAQDAYAPSFYPGRITLFWANDWSLTYSMNRQDLRLCWGDVAGDGLEVHVVPGDHLSFRLEPNITILAKKLSDCLRRAQQAASQRAERRKLIADAVN